MTRHDPDAEYPPIDPPLIAWLLAVACGALALLDVALQAGWVRL